MLLRCPASSLSSIRLTVWEKMSFEDLQNHQHGCHLGDWNRMILAIVNLHVALMLPTKVWTQSDLDFGSRFCLKIFKTASSNRTILAILNLYVAQMPPIKFRLNLAYGLGGDVIWRISRWLPSEQNNFSNSESLCHSNASHQVSAQSNLWFGRRCCLKKFKMASMAAILDIKMEPF